MEGDPLGKRRAMDHPFQTETSVEATLEVWSVLVEVIGDDLDVQFILWHIVQWQYARTRGGPATW